MAADPNDIPPQTKETIDRYVSERRPPGGFVMAVLRNDLAGAVGKADLTNRAHLPEIVAYLFNRCPAACWGSEEKVQNWLKPR
jgi:hypothetical protein